MTPERCAAADHLLAELVRIPSVDTSFEQACRDRAEERLGGFVAGLLAGLGLDLETHDLAPGRPTVIGTWPGPAEGTPLTLEAHLDTVGVDEMTIEPFAAEVRDGCLWGRGACDTKGSLAAFLTALHVADEEGWRFARPLQLAAVAGEETGCDGARALVETGVDLGEVIVGEPTKCDVVVAHKGCVWFAIETHGKSAHGSTPGLGRNAIYLMRRVLEFVEEQWIAALADHDDPLLGRSTASVGRIQGGEKVNVVPASCRLDVDWRLLPEDDPKAGLASLVTGLRAQLGPDADYVEVELAGPPQPGFGVPVDADLTRRMLAAAGDVRGNAEGRGVSYFTDAGIYAQAGCPCVVFGPGDIAHAHGQEERVELAEVHLAAEIILHLLAGLRVP